MAFAQGIAIPCLLFRGISELDLAAGFDWRLMASFYAGSIVCFALGTLGASYLVGRSPEDSVVIGFCALFGNTVLIGLAIVGRAYGGTTLEATFAIVTLHAPFCFLVGITTMELVKSRKRPLPDTVLAIGKEMFRNPMMVGISLGLLFNGLNLSVPEVAGDALDMVASAGLPAALFGLGGILVKYRPEGDTKAILLVCGLTLILHPLIAWLGTSQFFKVETELVRSATVTAAMAPGVNAYIFASMYNRAIRVAASSVLLGTAMSIFTASAWIHIVG